jgi:hypothetical protein
VVVVAAAAAVLVVVVNCLKHVSPFLSHHLLSDDVGLLYR